MTLDPKYTVTSDIETYFVNKDSGTPLSGGTLTFYKDSARNILKPVYELSGNYPNYNYIPLPNPLTLSSSGTVQDASGDNKVIYYYPYDEDGNSELYYVKCKDQNGVEQFTREAWPNVNSSSAGNQSVLKPPLNNQISNPTFTNVFLNYGYDNVLNFSAALQNVVPIAPDWDLVVSGSGSVTVKRSAQPGSNKIETSPPYFIDISTSSGITQCLLRQKTNENSGLWASTSNKSIYLYGSFVAKNMNPGSVIVGMYYCSSSLSSQVKIFESDVDIVYAFYSGGMQSPIPQSTDSLSGKDGSVSIYISIPANSRVQLSSIQVIPYFEAYNTNNPVPYPVDSSNRNEAYQGDFYIPQLATSPKKSFLVGWDFPVAPFQYQEPSITTTAQYIFDQTIGATFSGNASISVGLNGLVSVGLGSDLSRIKSFYIMQYLSGTQVQLIREKKLSVNVCAHQLSSSLDLKMQVHLYTGTTIPTLPISIGEISETGVFTITQSGWTEVNRSGLDTATAAILNTDSPQDYGFNGWDTTNISSKFAIVLTFATSGSSVNPSLNIKSISLTNGSIPSQPMYQTKDEVLRNCQVFYEQSFEKKVIPFFNKGCLYVYNGKFVYSAPNVAVYANVFQTVFKTPKRAIPIMRFYDPYSLTDVDDHVCFFLNDITTNIRGSQPITKWDIFEENIYTATMVPNATSNVPFNTPVTNQPQPFIVYHYTADARLGVVP